jgi:hypothetical protein
MKNQKLTFTITPENEKKLREQNRYKGDMSNIINQALEQYFMNDHTKEGWIVTQKPMYKNNNSKKE